MAAEIIISVAPFVPKGVERTHYGWSSKSFICVAVAVAVVGPALVLGIATDCVSSSPAPLAFHSGS